MTCKEKSRAIPFGGEKRRILSGEKKKRKRGVRIKRGGKAINNFPFQWKWGRISGWENRMAKTETCRKNGASKGNVLHQKDMENPVGEQLGHDH